MVKFDEFVKKTTIDRRTIPYPTRPIRKGKRTTVNRSTMLHRGAVQEADSFRGSCQQAGSKGCRFAPGQRNHTCPAEGMATWRCVISRIEWEFEQQLKNYDTIPVVVPEFLDYPGIVQTILQHAVDVSGSIDPTKFVQPKEGLESEKPSVYYADNVLLYLQHVAARKGIDGYDAIVEPVALLKQILQSATEEEKETLKEHIQGWKSLRGMRYNLLAILYEE